MVERNFQYEAKCPWCAAGKLMVEKPADTSVSCGCPYCSRFFVVDVNTMAAVKSSAVPNGNNNAGRRKRK